MYIFYVSGMNINHFFFHRLSAKMAAAQRRKSSDADMKLAFDDVMQNGVNVSKVARRHNVPRTTLIDRVKGRVNIDSKLGRPQALKNKRR